MKKCPAVFTCPLRNMSRNMSDKFGHWCPIITTSGIYICASCSQMNFAVACMLLCRFACPGNRRSPPLTDMRMLELNQFMFPGVSVCANSKRVELALSIQAPLQVLRRVSLSWLPWVSCNYCFVTRDMHSCWICFSLVGRSVVPCAIASYLQKMNNMHIIIIYI